MNADDAPDPWVAFGAPALPPPVEERPALSDLGAVALAVVVVLGAWWAHPLPLVVGVVVVAVALVRRRPVLFVLGAGALAATLGARAAAGLDDPRTGPYEGIVTLVNDPQTTPWGVRVDVRVGRKRYELQASQGAAGTVSRALAGERLHVEGRLRAPPSDAPWLRPRHVVGRLTVTSVDAHDGGAVPWRAANRVRRLLERGAEVMGDPARSLYRGFVLGDDRDQSPELVDDFRASGLTHLLVVSGSNVAYLLVLAGPLTRRLGLWWRWAVTLAVIASFSVITRFEPSILRASAMAAIAVTATLAGRPTASLRVLALAVSALVLIDPLLVHSIGFQLSVAASLGIVVASARITAALPGPRLLREALGVTLAAQVAVAPVLVPRFGGMPVVAIGANLAAVPAAGLVTTWGLPAGLASGILGPEVGRWLHQPTELAIGWVAGTARIAAGLPLGELEAAGLGVVVIASTGAALARSRGWSPWVTGSLAAVAAAALLAPAMALRHPPETSEPMAGAIVHRRGGATVLVLQGTGSAGRVLEALRRAGVRRLDVVVLEDDDPALLAALSHRWPVGRVIDRADGHAAPIELVVGGLHVRIGASTSSDERPVTVSRAPP